MWYWLSLLRSNYDNYGKVINYERQLTEMKMYSLSHNKAARMLMPEPAQCIDLSFVLPHHFQRLLAN